MGYDQSITQRRLEELKAVFEVENAAGVVDPSVDGLRQNASTLMDVLWGIRELGGDLSDHAKTLAAGPDADPKVVAALPHHEELISNLMAAWSSTAKIYEALQVLDPGREIFDGPPPEIDDDGEGWERAD